MNGGIKSTKSKKKKLRKAKKTNSKHNRLFPIADLLSKFQAWQPHTDSAIRTMTSTYVLFLLTKRLELMFARPGNL